MPNKVPILEITPRRYKDKEILTALYYFTHIIARIWLASFYRFTVNKSTMGSNALEDFI